VANLNAAKKSIRADARKRVFNDRKRRVLRESVKEFTDLVKEKKTEEASKLLPKVYQAIDKAAKKGLIKKNTASRKKSRLTKLVSKS
jgi:small subunit ribosomal protein S20